MSKREKNKALLVQYFEKGCKSQCTGRIGVELEHIVIDSKTRESVSYYGEHGIEKLIRRIAEKYPSRYEPEGRLIGVYNDDYSITLEPAGQFEVSISPKSEVEQVRQIYQSFLEIVTPVLDQWGYELFTQGYHPVSKVDDLRLIPKKRYEYMDRYFKTTGICGKNMMKGTSSTQVSIDYESEKDFILKIRAAYILMPLLKILTDNTPVFEGVSYQGHLARTYIWDHVDPDRTGIMKNLFAEDFGFEAYAKYLMDMPVIFREKQGEMFFTGSKRTADIWEDEWFTVKDIEHILSMNFQDVRLKQYLEIRYADSMPISYVLAYGALLKGIFYQKELIKQINESFSGKISDIVEAQENLSKYGLEGIVYGYPVLNLLEKLLKRAALSLDKSEAAWILPLEKIIRQKKTLAEERL